MNSKKNILIFGGSGFIGTFLCKWIDESDKFNYTIFDKNVSSHCPKKTLIGDVSNKIEINNTNNFDTIINLAAEHKDNISPSSLYYSVNVEGAINVCNFATQNNINNIIFTSSVAVYGLNNSNSSLNTPSPSSDYGRSKLMAESIYINWQSKSSNRSLTIIRPTVVFGEGNKGNFYNLVNQIYLKRFLMIGNGSNIKSLAYVKNLVYFLGYCLENPKNFIIYNYADLPNMKMTELVKKIYSDLGRKHNKYFVPKFIGLSFGKLLDIISKISGNNYPISYVRIKKFCANSEININIPNDFIRPFELSRGISETISYEIKKRRFHTDQH